MSSQKTNQLARFNTRQMKSKTDSINSQTRLDQHATNKIDIGQ
jgi:hypothetical protein